MINTIHNDYNKWDLIWRRIKDCVDGQDAVKTGRDLYLPMLNGQDLELYERYLQRAQFVNFVGRTLNIALGQIFRKNPVVENIDEDYINDINLDGQNLYYFSRDITSEVAKYNRCGILVDWSDEQQRPYLIKYSTFEIINWKEEKVNGIMQPAYIILQGYVEKEKDKYETENVKMYRVLELEEGRYVTRVYEEAKGKESAKERFVLIDERVPVKNGKPFEYIPFFFFTSNGLSTKIEKSILYDMVNVNLGHYINSADYENMLHWTGAKTLVTKGYAKETVPIGGSFNLPVDGDAMYLEASSDSGLRDEMQKKKEDMAVMGATLISGQGRYIASAETARINSSGEYASLADLSKSMSMCMSSVMREFVDWSGGKADKVSIEFNTDYELAQLDPAILTAYMGAVQSRYMSKKTFFYNMKNFELYPPDWTEEDEFKAIEEENHMEEIEIDEEDISQNQDED